MLKSVTGLIKKKLFIPGKLLMGVATVVGPIGEKLVGNNN